jgi:hypothetical protein
MSLNQRALADLITASRNSAGCKPCRSYRRRLFEQGSSALPKSWRKNWMEARIRATPKWADFEQIQLIYDEAARLTWLTGIEHTVDHVVPLRHPLVCGLHVAHNLQVLPKYINAAKGNAFGFEQLELFK